MTEMVDGLEGGEGQQEKVGGRGDLNDAVFSDFFLVTSSPPVNNGDEGQGQGRRVTRAASTRS
jgi:hypothetical protein